MKKKILVIGSNSFTGNNFVNYCLGKNYNIVGVSRSDQPNETLLSYKKNKLIKNFKFYKFNLNKDISKILSLIKKFKPEIIINYSAQGDVRHSWKNPSEWYETNSTAVVNLTSKLIDLDFIKKYISISTPEVYGSSKKKSKKAIFTILVLHMLLQSCLEIFICKQCLKNIIFLFCLHALRMFTVHINNYTE